jgi:hypothetical protein
VPLAQLSPLSYEISSTITYYCCQVISANRSLENRPVVFDEELRGRLLLIQRGDDRPVLSGVRLAAAGGPACGHEFGGPPRPSTASKAIARTLA